MHGESTAVVAEAVALTITITVGSMGRTAVALGHWTGLVVTAIRRSVPVVIPVNRRTVHHVMRRMIWYVMDTMMGHGSPAPVALTAERRRAGNNRCNDQCQCGDEGTHGSLLLRESESNGEGKWNNHG